MKFNNFLKLKIDKKSRLSSLNFFKLINLEDYAF